MISSDTTDEELAIYLQMFDFMNYDDAGLGTFYGEPGEYSDSLGEQGNSSLVVRD